MFGNISFGCNNNDNKVTTLFECLPIVCNRVWLDTGYPADYLYRTSGVDLISNILPDIRHENKFCHKKF